MKTTLNPERVTQEFLADLTGKHEKATRMLKDVVQDLTPEDTWLMVSSYRISPVEKQKHSISTKITNTARTMSWFEYPIVVEYWRGNVMFRYQKPKGHMFYVWVWAHPMWRAIEAFKQHFIYILNE